MNRETRAVMQVYANDPNKELNRLIKDPFHNLEFDTTMRFLDEYLPKKGLVLDAGGGPGRYTIELAKRGFDMILLDLVKDNLSLATKQIKKAGVKAKVKDIVEGSITDLSSFADNTFDAVICLGGPLSHVHPKKSRDNAISELVRVAKRGAPIFVSVMGKFGALLKAPYNWPSEVNDRKEFRRIVFNGDDYRWWKTGFCHFFTLEEFRGVFADKPVDIIKSIGLEGLNTNSEVINRFAKKYPKAWKNWLEVHYELCTNPSIVEISLHMLIVARKNK
jgi:ubiquinone/menaquinone biosynthesis C-methylase UbiE